MQMIDCLCVVTFCIGLSAELLQTGKTGWSMLTLENRIQ